MGRGDDIRLPEDTPFLRNPAAIAVSTMLEGAGYQALFVGGCVRNAVMGHPQSDIDMSTDARPQQVLALAEAAGFKSVPTGLDHGTVTVVAHDVPIEITTFRRDVQTDGRRAVVAFSDRIEDDARRRDFTMNALYARITGDIVDPLGGLPDALAGRVVFIEDAGQRIREDYLRILRFFRFSTFYGSDAFDPDTLAAIADNLDGLTSLSAERIGTEMIKILSGPDPSPPIATMQQIGVLQRVMPCSDVTVLPVLVALEERTDTYPDAIRRLAVLGAQDPQNDLRLSRRMARDLSHLRDSVSEPHTLKALGHLLGAVRGWDAALVRAAILGTPLKPSDTSDVRAGSEAEFPVQASDLKDKYEGAELGEKLRALKTEWLKSDLTLDRDALLG